MTSTMTADLSRLTLGTAPDSWGVWFATDPHQVGWKQYLDEIATAGYLFTELGPQGFMPQDPEQLKDELAARGLTVCGGTVFAGLHRGAEALESAKQAFGQEARLLAAVGAKYLVHLPEQWTDMHTGAAVQNAEIDLEQWKNLVGGTDELARYLFQEFGVECLQGNRAGHFDLGLLAAVLEEADQEIPSRRVGGQQPDRFDLRSLVRRVRDDSLRDREVLGMDVVGEELDGFGGRDKCRGGALEPVNQSALNVVVLLPGQNADGYSPQLGVRVLDDRP